MSFKTNAAISISVTLVIAILATTIFSQDFEKIEIKKLEVAKGVYMLTGRGGNIGVSSGKDGIFLIDDQYAQLSEKIRAVLTEISSEPIRFVLNTHFHGDHTGGNEPAGAAGALIVSHQNTRKRLTTEQFIEFFQSKQPASPEVALPVVTFTDTVTFHLNGDEVLAFHVREAHTDGDVIVFFRKANVIHMGDVYFAKGYPFFDVPNGGSVDGILRALDNVLAMVDKDCRVIPGHGPLSDRAGMQEYRDMLATVRDRVRAQVSAGKTLTEVIASKPTADFDDGRNHGLPAEGFLKVLYNELSQKN